jgi:HNH endonuclease.
MTIKPLKPCKHAGCRAYAEKEGYCLKHYKERFSYYFQDKRISPSKLGYNRRWDHARKEFLKLHPLCVICGCPATEVDHIIPHRGNKQLFWNVNNWQSLCHTCHSKKTAREVGLIGMKENDKDA